MRTLKNRLGNIEEGLGKITLDMVTTGAITDWMDRVGFAGVNRKNYRKELAALFNWATKQSFVSRNPALAITIPRMDERLPEFLTVEQAQALFRTAEETCPATLPYLALAAFAGLRRAEIERMDASAMTDGTIRVTAQAAKLRQQRFVTICRHSQNG
jgi:site-specific recombinase XerD